MNKKPETKKQETKVLVGTGCNDKTCWKHHGLKVRGRNFEGYVIKKFPRRIVIEFERVIYIPKYERYMKKKTKLHARLPDCMISDVQLGDYVEIGETRPLSKITHFVFLKVVRKKEVKQ